MRDIQDIKSDLKTATLRRENIKNVNNEGGEGYNDETQIELLSAELIAAEKAQSPLKLNLSAERSWFNAQGFTGADMQKAQKACVARGYTVADLMAASKAAK